MREQSIAVAVACYPLQAGPSLRRRTRITLALAADSHGYTLADVVELDRTRPTGHDRALEELADLAWVMNADAVLISGATDLPQLEALAYRFRMVVLPLPDPALLPWPIA